VITALQNEVKLFIDMIDSARNVLDRGKEADRKIKEDDRAAIDEMVMGMTDEERRLYRLNREEQIDGTTTCQAHCARPTGTTNEAQIGAAEDAAGAGNDSSGQPGPDRDRSAWWRGRTSRADPDVAEG